MRHIVVKLATTTTSLRRPPDLGSVPSPSQLISAKLPNMPTANLLRIQCTYGVCHRPNNPIPGNELHSIEAHAAFLCCKPTECQCMEFSWVDPGLEVKPDPRMRKSFQFRRFRPLDLTFPECTIRTSSTSIDNLNSWNCGKTSLGLALFHNHNLLL